jgi:hypothetical protein
MRLGLQFAVRSTVVDEQPIASPATAASATQLEADRLARNIT